MSKGTKIALIIGIVLVVGVGGYFLYQKMKSDGKDENDDSTDDQKPPEGGEEVIKDISSTSSFDPTPFKNKSQGDYFRLWLNRYYPKDAKALDLDKSGPQDNSTIRKAFTKYGVLYKQQVKNWDKLNTTIPSAFAQKFDKKDSYNFKITDSGQIALLPKVKFTNEGINFNSNGKWYQGSKNSGNWWAGGTQANYDGKNYKEDNFFALSKLIDSAISSKTLNNKSNPVGGSLKFVDFDGEAEFN